MKLFLLYINFFSSKTAGRQGREPVPDRREDKEASGAEPLALDAHALPIRPETICYFPEGKPEVFPPALRRAEKQALPVRGNAEGKGNEGFPDTPCRHSPAAFFLPCLAPPPRFFPFQINGRHGRAASFCPACRLWSESDHKKAACSRLLHILEIFYVYTKNISGIF